MKKKYYSKMLQVIHEDMKGMHELGIISDAEMRKFDEECLVQEPEPIYKPANPARTVRRGIGMKKSITPRRKGVKKGV